MDDLKQIPHYSREVVGQARRLPRVEDWQAEERLPYKSENRVSLTFPTGEESRLPGLGIPRFNDYLPEQDFFRNEAPAMRHPLILLVLFAFPGFSFSFENGSANNTIPFNAIGKRESEIVKAWGQPTGRLDLGNKAVLFFDQATVTLRNGNVVECQMRNLERERKAAQEAEAEMQRRMEFSRQQEQEALIRQQKLEKELADLKATEEAIAKKVADLNDSMRVPSILSAPGVPLLGGYGIRVLPGGVVCGGYSVAEVERARACVIQQNLADIQNGNKILLPNLDPQTACFRKGASFFKAVDRQTVEAVGGFNAARLPPADNTSSICPIVQPTIFPCGTPQQNGVGFVIVIR